ncbi:hypothetical protein V2J09_002934 [Rumex salicifolius]
MSVFSVKLSAVSPRTLKIHCKFVAHSKNQPKYVRYPRRTKIPPESGILTFRKKNEEAVDDCHQSVVDEHDHEFGGEAEEEDVDWDADEIEAISSLFQGRIPLKPGKPAKQRPLPLPVPHKIRPIGLPTAKRRVKSAALQEYFSGSLLKKDLHKDPIFLTFLAREIQTLSSEEDVSRTLSIWGRFLRKGSLSLTIRELGHMGLPDRALQTFSWAQKQSHLFPDDRILASTVEVLAGSRSLKSPFNPVKFISLGSRSVLEAIARGFIKGQRLDLAWNLLSTAKSDGRMLGSSIYAKLILELAKSSEKHDFVISLLEELAGREDLNLNQMDCTAIMKVSAQLGRFELVEGLFDWFKQSGQRPSVVMYTTVIHSRYCGKQFREALEMVWEMEASNCVLDLPAYRVLIKLFVALNDLSRATRYFAKLKEAARLTSTLTLSESERSNFCSFGNTVCKRQDIYEVKFIEYGGNKT